MFEILVVAFEAYSDNPDDEYVRGRYFGARAMYLASGNFDSRAVDQQVRNRVSENRYFKVPAFDRAPVAV